MPIKIKYGDMFCQRAHIRVNPVNCVGVAGKGLALVFKQRYPGWFDAYEKACGKKLLCPGWIHEWEHKSGGIVLSVATKNHWRDKSNIDDIHMGCLSLRAYLQCKGSSIVTIPALGCGCGELKWDTVKPIIEKYLSCLPCNIYLYNIYDPVECIN